MQTDRMTPTTEGGAAAKRTVTLLPDPEPRPRHHVVISVDDHLIEPGDVFEGRVPHRFADDAPRIVECDDGTQQWLFEDRLHPQIGLNAIAGRPQEEWSMDPARFDEMRRGCWDPDARVHDMDLAGIWASLCFPSLIAGFAGTAFSQSRDPELGLACVRAWNDWHIEAWTGPHPDRLIPLQLPWLADPAVAAAEVRRNAARGFKAVSMPENPAHLGLPSVHTDHWDPLLEACEDTGTVVCLHTGSSFWTPVTSPGAPLEELTTMFPVNALVCAADWLWSGVPVRFPRIRIAMSEGGIGWVPMLLDRLDYIMAHSAKGGDNSWRDPAHSPAEVLHRNFWFCMVDDPSTLPLRHRVGVDRIMVDVDFPHADTTWPDIQPLLAERLRDVPEEEARMITHGNAAALFSHPLPPDGWLTAGAPGGSR